MENNLILTGCFCIFIFYNGKNVDTEGVKVNKVISELEEASPSPLFFTKLL